MADVLLSFRRPSPFRVAEAPAAYPVRANDGTVVVLPTREQLVPTSISGGGPLSKHIVSRSLPVHSTGLR
jgi:hypothetical protein